MLNLFQMLGLFQTHCNNVWVKEVMSDEKFLIIYCGQSIVWRFRRKQMVICISNNSINK